MSHRRVEGKQGKGAPWAEEGTLLLPLKEAWSGNVLYLSGMGMLGQIERSMDCWSQAGGRLYLQILLILCLRAFSLWGRKQKSSTWGFLEECYHNNFLGDVSCHSGCWVLLWTPKKGGGLDVSCAGPRQAAVLPPSTQTQTAKGQAQMNTCAQGERKKTARHEKVKPEGPGVQITSNQSTDRSPYGVTITFT